jgi:peptidoglycan/LPS O-acetylase OafA/YrhL
VFCFHYLGAVFGIDQLPFSGNWLDFHRPPRPEFLPFWPMSLGWVGVPLFFVISGFCIHLSYLRQDRFSALRFYGKRLARLSPPYVLVFLSSWALAFQRHEPRVWLQLVAHLFFLQNLFDNDIVFGINGALWSLATEMQFYLLFPLLLLFVPPKRRFGWIVVLTASFVFMVASRLATPALQNQFPQFSAAIATSPFILIFDWLLGVNLAECWWRADEFWLSRGYCLFAAAGFFVVTTLWRPASVFSFPAASLCFAGIAGRLDFNRQSQNIAAKTLRYVGVGSYSFYLVHQPVSAWLLEHFPIQGTIPRMTVGLLLIAAATFGVSQVVFYLVEKPFWRSR